MLIPGEDFIFGVNLPWFEHEYGHDIGPSQHLGGETEVWYRGAEVSRCFEAIRNIGFTHARVWLMEGAEGWMTDDAGLLNGLHPMFLENLDDLVRRAGNQKIRLYLCLINRWEQCFGREMKRVPYPSPFSDPRQTDAYLTHAVRPIAERLAGNETVFAFDAVNEIEAEVSGIAPARNPHPITPNQARTFVRRTVETVKAADPNRMVGCGSGYVGPRAIEEGHYAQLGLDFYDLHAYSDEGDLPAARSLAPDMPVLLGEFGQGTEVEDDDLQVQADIAHARNAHDKGYAGWFVWSYGPERFHSLRHLDGGQRPVVAALRDVIREQRSPIV